MNDLDNATPTQLVERLVALLTADVMSAPARWRTAAAAEANAVVLGARADLKASIAAAAAAPAPATGGAA